MTVKPDQWIIRMARDARMIDPFEPGQVRTGISFGTGSYGYDFRLSREFKLFDAAAVTGIDPKDPATHRFIDHTGDHCDIPPGSFILARTMEYFRIPRNVVTIAFGKSTYARAGVLVNVTPFEPEWEGFATISISNTAPVPARVHAGEGIGQLLFFESDEPCAVSYADKKGKYQAQIEITHAKGRG